MQVRQWQTVARPAPAALGVGGGVVADVGHRAVAEVAHAAELLQLRVQPGQHDEGVVVRTAHERAAARAQQVHRRLPPRRRLHGNAHTHRATGRAVRMACTARAQGVRRRALAMVNRGLAPSLALKVSQSTSRHRAASSSVRCSSVGSTPLFPNKKHTRVDVPRCHFIHVLRMPSRRSTLAGPEWTPNSSRTPLALMRAALSSHRTGGSSACAGAPTIGPPACPGHTRDRRCSSLPFTTW